MSGRNTFLLFATLLTACGDEHGQTLGNTSGLFSQVPTSNVSCGMLAIGGISLDAHFEVTDTKKDMLDLELRPLAQADVHVQYETRLAYGSGDALKAMVDVERGHERVNPDLSGDVAQQALELRTNLYFPLYLNEVRVTGGQVCNVDPVTNVRDTTDCLDIPDSTIEGGRIWCTVGPDVGPEWTK